jgi:hypothetical protein
MQLFLKNEREKIIENCVNHCKINGMIMISCLSKMDILFGIGNQFEENTFEFGKDLTIHFSDEMEMNNSNRSPV